MSTWVRLPGGIETTASLPEAVRADVAFVPGAPFSAADPDHANLRMSSTRNPPRRSPRGCDDWRGCCAREPTSSTGVSRRARPPSPDR
jgi:DNA-binding transcriptional MocR family regulator